MIEEKSKNKITEIIGPSIPLDVKNHIRLGEEASKKYTTMMKHLDTMYIYEFINREVFTNVFLMSLSKLYGSMSNNAAKRLGNYLAGTYTNIQAYAAYDMSIQELPFDDRDFHKDTFMKSAKERILYFLDEHLKDLDEIKEISELGKVQRRKLDIYNQEFIV